MGLSRIPAQLMAVVLGVAGCGGDDDARSVPAEQASPEAVVEAYFDHAEANDPAAMFALISPDLRDGLTRVRSQLVPGFTLAQFTACVSDQLADISGAEVAFEHSNTYVDDGSTFVEAEIVLSEQGEDAVPSDDLEVFRLPVAIEAVEIDGLWWTAGEKGGDPDFACAREGIDEVGPAGPSESGEDDRGPVVDEEWSIALDDEVRGTYVVVMIKTFSPLEKDDIEDLGGRLVWEEAEIELCAIGIRSVGDGFVQIGDIFQTTEECEGNTEMQQTFDDFGPPEAACVFVRVDGVDDDHCAPLTIGIAEEEAEPHDDAALVGVWTGTEVGQATGPWTFVFDQGAFSMVSSGVEVYRGSYVAFPGENPKRMEAAVTESMVRDHVGETAHTIYKFDGSTLILASNEPGVADAPTGFSPGGGTRVWELTPQ